jgi:CheY-like chemotaxis protein
MTYIIKSQYSLHYSRSWLMEKPNENLNTIIRKALNHLYNPEYLRRSPLVSILGIAGRFDTAKSLQRILNQAIESVKYKPGGSRDERRVYYHDLLYYRYVQKISQEEVASKFGISLRQFTREQDHSIDILAVILAEKYPVLADMLNNAQATPSVHRDVEANYYKLDPEPPELPVNISRELNIVKNIVEPLARQKQIVIDTHLPPVLSCFLIHPVAFRQALLSMLNIAIHYAGMKKIFIQAQKVERNIQINLKVDAGSDAQAVEISIEDQASLEYLCQLVELNEGKMDFALTMDGFTADLSLPSYQQLIVLLIDDYPDFQRFIDQSTQNTRYQIINIPNPDHAIEQAKKYSVDCILLDVMASDFDGWQLLVKLHNDPLTNQIPVIVCTTSPLVDLAYSNGARAFLHKPFPKEMLLNTLDQWVK